MAPYSANFPGLGNSESMSRTHVDSSRRGIGMLMSNATSEVRKTGLLPQVDGSNIVAVVLLVVGILSITARGLALWLSPFWVGEY